MGEMGAVGGEIKYLVQETHQCRDRIRLVEAHLGLLLGADAGGAAGSAAGSARPRVGSGGTRPSSAIRPGELSIELSIVMRDRTRPEIVAIRPAPPTRPISHVSHVSHASHVSHVSHVSQISQISHVSHVSLIFGF